MERHFNEKSYYQSKVLRQSIYFNADDIPSLVLEVKLEGQLVDVRKPEAGVLDCPNVNVEVRLTLTHENEDRLGYALKDLESLGFDGDDLERLNPANRGNKKANFFELEGKQVYVTPQYKTYNDRESIFWNLRFPKARHDREAEKGELGKSKAAEAFKALREKKAAEALADAPAGF